MRRMAKGTKVAMTSRAPPASTAEKPEPWSPVPAVPDATAPAARLSVATMTNLERMSAASVSTRRRLQGEIAGQTRGEHPEPQHEGRHRHQQCQEEEHEAGDRRVERRRGEARGESAQQRG